MSTDNNRQYRMRDYNKIHIKWFVIIIPEVYTKKCGELGIYNQ